MMPVTTNAPLHGLDGSDAIQAPSGYLHLTGWLAGWDDTVCVLIRLRLGTDLIYDCESGRPRPDVAAAHPHLSDAASSGFVLSTHVPPGFHVGAMEYCVVGRTDWTAFRTVSLVAGLSPLQAQLEAPLPSAPGNWYVHGWCFHPQARIESLTVQCGRHSAMLEHGMARPDIAAAHPGYPGAEAAGFAGHLPVEPGNAPVLLRARLTNGSVLAHPLVDRLALPDTALQLAVTAANQRRAARIRLSLPETPEVSIVIPIHNQLELTLGCLESLARHPGRAGFEVIIVDDCSSPEAGEVLAGVNGLTVLKNETNLGFVRSCNRGANAGRGRYVLMLNNDTEVRPGWLDALVDTFATHPDAGLVGAKLLFADGTLQEAGGICWNDGSAWNFGRHQDPSLAVFNYVREADYCSGACIIVPKDLWDELGGFDPHFAPAYYEDSDLAFRIRARGRKVYYQPRCVVVHFEGQSNGTDTGRGVKRHQVINQARFVERWREVLARDHFDPGTNLFHARDRSRDKPVLLMCDHYVPMFDRDAGSRTIYEYLRLFVTRGFQIKFLPDNLYPHQPYTAALEQLGVEVLYGGHYIDTVHDWLRENGRHFDYIFISRANVACKYLDTLKSATGAPIFFYGSDLHFMRMENEAAVLGTDNRNEVAAMRRMEEDVLHQVDVVYYPADFECEWVRRHFPGKRVRGFPIYIYPEGDDPAPAYADTADLLFVAGFGHPPNCTALRWFIDNILGDVLARVPGLRLNVAGSNIPSEILALQSDHIRFFPDLSDQDLAALYARTRVCVVPLRYGGGVKGKVVDALYRRNPLVTTSIGAQGLEGIEKVARISDSPPEFAAHVADIYQDQKLWTTLSQSSRPYILERFSLAAVSRMLAEDMPEFRGKPGV